MKRIMLLMKMMIKIEKLVSKKMDEALNSIDTDSTSKEETLHKYYQK